MVYVVLLSGVIGDLLEVECFLCVLLELEFLG